MARKSHASSRKPGPVVVLLAACAAAIAATIVVAGVVSSGQAADVRSETAARIAAASQCADAIGQGEAVAMSTADAIAALPDVSDPAKIRAAVSSIGDRQQPAQRVLSICMADPHAPAECAHSASVLLEIAADQSRQAALIQKALTSSTADDAASATARIASLQRDIGELSGSVNDTACTDYAAGQTGNVSAG